MEDMCGEYDFVSGERGKFHRKTAVFIPPVQINPELLAYFAERAEKRGVPLDQLINRTLQKGMELIEAAE